jgi:hypothetical protein
MTALTHIGTIAGAGIAKSRKRLIVLSLAAIALLIGVASGGTYSRVDPVFALSSQTDIGSMSASRKVRCIMPPAWRKDCGA